MTGYCTVNDVNERLRMDDEERDDNSTIISNKIDDAYRIITLAFSQLGSTAPNPSGSLTDDEVILEDINADLAAALYREDIVEFTDLAGERPVDKSWIWKQRAMKALEKFVTNYVRPITDDDLYVKKVN